MHPNQKFHTQSDAANLAFARETGFGLLAVNGPDAPLMAHIPFLLSDDFQTIELHLLRSNPIVRAAGTPIQARLAVSGPDGYISPDWYEADDQVPTWNYVAVHIWGALEVLPHGELGGVLDRVSAHFERQIPGKRAGTRDKMTEEGMERMMRTIVPLRMKVAKVDGTWKLNQNKPDDVRLRAADAVDMGPAGSQLSDLARMMREG